MNSFLFDDRRYKNKILKLFNCDTTATQLRHNCDTTTTHVINYMLYILLQLRIIQHNLLTPEVLKVQSCS